MSAEWVVYYVGRTGETVAIPKSRWLEFTDWVNSLDEYQVKLVIEGLTEAQAKAFVALTKEET